MSSSEPSGTNSAVPSALAQLRSNWIEIFAVPIASAIMETQPIALVLSIAIPQLFGKGNPLPDAFSITLMMLGLHWWAMWLKNRGQADNMSLSIGGLIVAVGIYIGLHINVIDYTMSIIVTLGLAAWFWKRGVDRARLGLSDEQLITAFKIGFVVLLGILIFAFLSALANNTALTDAMLRDLPIFFLSGLIALSFTRIGILKKEQARHGNGGRRDGTSSWLTAMTIVWFALVAVSIALQALPLNVLLSILQPFWTLLGWIALGIAYVFGLLSTLFFGLFFLVATALLWIIQAFFGKPENEQASPMPPPEMPKIIRPEDVTDNSNALILRIVIAVVILMAVIIIARFMKNKQKKVEDTIDDEEELRESLDRDQILRERRAERKPKPQAIELETLPALSIRARYREFLTALAAKELTRQANETPEEFAQRVLVETRQPAVLAQTDPQSSPALLQELTQAYNRERYGGKQLGDERQNQIRQWVPQLIQRVTERIVPKIKNPTRTYQASRWGED